MKLSFVSITNYRSITEAYKIDFNDQTILLGKNNEGKTNIIKAINVGMELLNNVSFLGRRKIVPKQLYDWNNDFPITLQTSKKLKDKSTTIRFDFCINEKESLELYEIISSRINDALSIYISIDNSNSLSITVPKKGKNAKAISSKIVEISKFICDRFSVQYIPAVRLEDEVYSLISELVDTEFSAIDDPQYLESLQYIEKTQQEKLNNLSKNVEKPLKTFLPQIKSVKLFLSNKYRRTSYFTRRNLVINVDDGVLTDLTSKGDGIKSLATIALLSQVSAKSDRLIIIDEPENHLHPEAIRYISSVVNELSTNNQILVSTHSPIFINRRNISSNIIVSKGEAIKAKKITDIRNVLGVICSDNLMFSDYVIVVEGPSDRELMVKLLSEDNDLNKYLSNGIITVRSTGGTNNLQSEIYALQRYCCNFFVILDGDSAGKKEANCIRQNLSVPNDQIRLIMSPSCREMELEDLYDPELYRDYLLERDIDIDSPHFKNKSIKWSDRIQKIKESIGSEFIKSEEDRFKEDISKMISSPLENCLTTEGYELLCTFKKKIKNDLLKMNATT